MLKIQRVALVLLVFLISSSVAMALDMEDCRPGRTVYIDELFDKEVKILKRDYSDNTVKVKLKNGSTRWVKPSKLMSSLGKEVEDYIEEQAADFLIKCFFGDACQNSNSK